jgi:hypothetical protein
MRALTCLLLAGFVALAGGCTKTEYVTVTVAVTDQPATVSSTPTAAAPTPTPTPDSLHLSGSITLTTGDDGCCDTSALRCIKPNTSFGSCRNDVGAGGPCVAWGDFADVKAGTPIEVHDQSGAIVALDRLTADTGTIGVAGAQVSCRFPFTLDLPAGPTFYLVQIGTRPALKYSAAEIVAPGALDLTPQ